VSDPPADAVRAERMDAATRTARVLTHQVANYLGAAHVMVQLLAERVPSNPGFTADLGLLDKSLDGLARLVEALRGFAHPPPLGQGAADLNAALRDAEPSLRALVRPGATLHLRLARGSLQVRGDAPRLHQLAADLVAAAGADLPDGGRVEIETGRASEAAGRPPSALLVVRGNGRGLAVEEASRLFEPFVYDASSDGGLRLPSIYTTVTRAGGTVAGESSPATGTTIRITLPLAAPEPAGTASA
jgi:signal transduction histidine kinase